MQLKPFSVVTRTAKESPQDTRAVGVTPGRLAFGLRYFARARRGSADFPLLDLLFTAPFIGLFLVQLAHHKMWRDELNAFGIALASPSLPSLFWHVHYEGHPWLWYALLWVVSRFTPLPMGMKILEAFIGTAIYLLIGVGSPFGRIEKLLLFLSYFISFEYTVITRMYGVLLLVLLLYLRQRVLHPDRFLGNAMLLGLLASTDINGFILSFALLIEYVLSFAVPPKLVQTPAKRHIVYGFLCYFGLAAISIWSLKPAPDISWRTTGHLFEFATDWQHLLLTLSRYVVLPYFPIRLPTSGYFWNPRIATHPLVFLSLVPLVLATYYAIFRRHRNFLLFMGFMLASSIAFGHLIYDGSMRHFGMMFLAFLAGIWILRSQSQKLPTLSYLLLGLSATAGIIAGVESWHRPFSNAEAAANWIKANHLDTTAIAGTPDTSVAGVAELLRRPVYFLDCNCIDSVLLFSIRRDDFTTSQISDRLLVAKNSLNVSSFIFVGTVPLSAAQESQIKRKGLIPDPLASFTGAEAEGEDFHIYRIRQQHE